MIKSISIVIPVFNEEKNVLILYPRLKSVLDKLKIKYEIIFVDDGSTDNTLINLKKTVNKDSNVKIVSFFKNMGKAEAYAIGFEQATGEYIFTMDGDLQDAPEDIPLFIQKLDGKIYDLINGWKKSKHRGDLINRILSKMFNKILSLFSGIKIHDFNCPYRLIKKEAAKQLNIYGGLHRYIPLLIYLEGYTNICEIPIRNFERRHGKSKYGFSKMYSGMFDMMTAVFIKNYLKRPLHFFGTIGFLCLLVATGIFVHIFNLSLNNKSWTGRPSLILFALFCLLGIQFISLGFLGELMSRSLSEKKEGRKKHYLIYSKKQ